MKRLYIMMVLLLTGIMAVAQTSVWDGSRKLWTSGEGTANNPYLINSAENLAFLSYMVGKGFETQGLYFRLTTDIDLNGSEDQPWIPIGLFDRGFDDDGCDRGDLNGIGYTPYTAFRGHFDGGGHVISNLFVDTPGYAGLFGIAGNQYGDEKAVIENVFVRDGYIKGRVSGGIVGHGADLVVSHCRNSAMIEGLEVGGIMGEGARVRANNCSNSGQLVGSHVGGIVGGRQSRAVVTECFNEGDIMASEIGGGIICETYNALSGNGYIAIDNCYNTGAVSAIGDTSTYYPSAGGLVGNAGRYFVAKNSYNAGEVTSNHHLGCLIGYTPFPDIVNTENCYYLDICFESIYGMVKSAEEMRDEAFVAVLNQGGSVWGADEKLVNDGFPILKKTNLSVNDNTDHALMVYPNPTHNNVRIAGIEAAEVQVYNALGQLMRTVRNNNEFNLQGLPKGIYALRVTDIKGCSSSVKVVKE